MEQSFLVWGEAGLCRKRAAFEAAGLALACVYTGRLGGRTISRGRSPAPPAPAALRHRRA